MRIACLQLLERRLRIKPERHRLRETGRQLIQRLLDVPAIQQMRRRNLPAIRRHHRLKLAEQTRTLFLQRVDLRLETVVPALLLGRHRRQKLFLFDLDDQLPFRKERQLMLIRRPIAGQRIHRLPDQFRKPQPLRRIDPRPNLRLQGSELDPFRMRVGFPFPTSFHRGLHLGSRDSHLLLDGDHSRKKRLQRVILFLSQRVVFVVVTLRAAQRLPQQHRPHRRRQIVQRVLTRQHHVRSIALVGRQTQKPGPDQRRLRFGIQLVASNLLGEKPIVGRVVVEGGNHVIAILPRQRPQRVGVVTGRVRVPHQVQPDPSPPLPVMRAGQPRLDPLPVGRVGRIGFKRRQFFRSGRQTEQIKLQPSQKLRGPRGRCRLHTLLGPPLRQQPIDGRYLRTHRFRQFRPHHGAIGPRPLSRFHRLRNGFLGGVARIRPSARYLDQQPASDRGENNSPIRSKRARSISGEHGNLLSTRRTRHD